MSRKNVAFEEFEGFSQPTQQGHFVMPQEWAIISRYIDNLAEYKISEYIIRHCWSAGNIWMEITTEQFMNGFTYDDGEVTDLGTGLSKQSVLTGIEKAIEHGLVECAVDERGGNQSPDNYPRYENKSASKSIIRGYHAHTSSSSQAFP